MKEESGEKSIKTNIAKCVVVREGWGREGRTSVGKREEREGTMEEGTMRE